MTEIEKVKKGLALCLTGEASACKDCPYYAECKEAVGIGPSPLRRDALKLLEEQEALEKRLADHDRIKVIRCADCAWWEANNAEEGDTSGYCRKNAECENALTDMTFFCGSAERR